MMKIKAIGASGGTAPGYRTTCYFIDDQFLIDCGAAASGLSLEQQSQIENIFITHPHLDHVKDIAFLVENSFSSQRKQLNLRSSEEILDDVHSHIFNNVIWPDFSEIVSNAKSGMSMLQFSPFEEYYEFEGYKVSMIEVNHPGNAVGFVVDDGMSQVLFSGDTGPTEEIWKIANQQENLVAIFTEISFPNALSPLAEASGHFTLDSLLVDLKKIKKNVPVYINHFKPQYFSELVKEFHEKAPQHLTLLHQDHEIDTD